MDLQTGKTDGADVPEEAHKYLIGGAGSEYVLHTLTRVNPNKAVPEVQSTASMRQNLCHPVMGMLDQMQVQRAEAHKAVLQGACTMLLGFVERMPHEALLQLLDRSFPYIGIPELRAVPMAVLGRLSKVPVHYLKQLSHDTELFEQLPQSVCQQVWELDKRLMQQHVLPLLTAYCNDVPLVRRMLHMDACVRSGPRAPPVTARRTLRSASKPLQSMVKIVGTSRQIYNGIVELCCVQFRDGTCDYLGMRQNMVATLRGQLLMALHEAQASEITSSECCHKVAWAMDACLKDGTLDQRHLQEFVNFFSLYENMQDQPKSVTKKAKRRALGDAESAGGIIGSNDPNRALGDAAMILADPPTQYLIVSHILKRLLKCVSESSQPRHDVELPFLTSMLLMSMRCQTMHRERRFYIPEAPPKLILQFYPIICCMMLESSLLASDDEELPLDPKAEYGLDATLADVVTKEPAARRVLQMYSLERLAVRDLLTARKAIEALATALAASPEDCAPEWAPYGFSLARRVGPLAKEGLVAPADALWVPAVEGLLMKLLASEATVHEDTIKVLKVAASKNKTPATQVAGWLETTLAAHDPHTAFAKGAPERVAIDKQYTDCFTRFPELANALEAAPLLARYAPVPTTEPVAMEEG